MLEFQQMHFFIDQNINTFIKCLINACFLCSHFLYAISLLEQRRGNGCAPERSRQYGSDGWTPAEDRWAGDTGEKSVCVCAFFRVVCICMSVFFPLAERGRTDPRPAEPLRLQTVYNSIETADLWTQDRGEHHKHTHTRFFKGL